MKTSITKVYPLIVALVSMTSCTPTNATLQASATVSSVRTSHAEATPIDYFTTCWIASPLKVNPYLRCMFHDKDGNYWFGTDGMGVCCYNGKNYTKYTVKDGLANNFVSAIREDHQGLWFTTRAGLSLFNGLSFRNFPAAVGADGKKKDGC